MENYIFFDRSVNADDKAWTTEDNSAHLMHFGGHQSLCLLNCLRSKNTLKQGKFWKFSKVTAKPKVMENLKRAWKWKVMEFEELKRERTLC